MNSFNLVMPKLGESVQEATIIRWLVKPGDSVEEDDSLLEIATDKVDSEIPSPVAGKILEVLFPEGALVPVGETIALIQTIEGESQDASVDTEGPVQTDKLPLSTNKSSEPAARFYSPLVLSIAARENVNMNELNALVGTGTNNRVRKQDVLNFIQNRHSPVSDTTSKAQLHHESQKGSGVVSTGDEVVPMDRMRKLIAEHMIYSIQTSVHVTNFVEADVTHLVLWREKMKDEFYKKQGIKLTYMPVFIEAAARALREYPGINASVEGDNIILRKFVNIGFAVALSSGNLIVPVLRQADQKSLVGIAAELNRLSDSARAGKLSPDDIQGGTFTISNFGTFRNLTGTPIINQPQVAILATGTIEKKPAVIETPTGDVIAIRHKMILSLSYDHRIIDGALGGMFLRRMADILEDFDINRLV
jgi:2-oxoglutarate dehydrogenase E2 component (dihydrolipoamide succinyltransferase)